jgi:hypothetical protein
MTSSRQWVGARLAHDVTHDRTQRMMASHQENAAIEQLGQIFGNSAKHHLWQQRRAGCSGHKKVVILCQIVKTGSDIIAF